MCSINHDKKCVFIHIPKNGGSYVAEILSKNYGFKNYYLHRPDHKQFCLGIDKSVDKHENKIHGTLIYYKTSPHLNKIMNMNEQKWNSYFIFTFIRNPYDKIVSGWNYVNKWNIPFKNYININYNANSYDYWHVFMTQTRHLIDTNGKINIGYIGKFENMESDLKEVLLKIGFNKINHTPFKKNSKKHDNYMTYYMENSDTGTGNGTDTDTVNTVNQLMKEDFDNFDYSLI